MLCRESFLLAHPSLLSPTTESQSPGESNAGCKGPILPCLAEACVFCVSTWKANMAPYSPGWFVHDYVVFGPTFYSRVCL